MVTVNLCWKKIIIGWGLIATAAAVAAVDLQRGHDLFCTAVNITGLFHCWGEGGADHSQLDRGRIVALAWRPYHQLAVSTLVCYLYPPPQSSHQFSFHSISSPTSTHTARRRSLLRSHWSHQKIHGRIFRSQGCDQIQIDQRRWSCTQGWNCCTEGIAAWTYYSIVWCVWGEELLVFGYRTDEGGRIVWSVSSYVGGA